LKTLLLKMKNPPLVDLIISPVRIYDPIDGFLPHNAVAICGNRIVALGSEEDLLALKQKDTQVLEAANRILMPSLTDSHTHFLEYVRRKQQVDLEECRSLSEALKVINEKVKRTPEGEWVTGGGWNRNLWGENDYPTRHHLDRISTRHFIALDSKDWHTTWVNTPVLNLAGIPLDKLYPNARHQAIDPVSGEFTGILEEEARMVIFDLIPKYRYDQLWESYQTTLREFYQLGFSGIHTVEMPNDFSIFQEAYHRGEIGLRTFWYLPVKHTGAAREIGLNQGFGNDFLQIVGVKIFVDGSFGSQTAELFENYSGLNHAGVEVVTLEQLDHFVHQAVDAGLSCAIHSIGDKAIHKCLQVLAKFDQESREKNLHHRIEHAQLIQPEDLPLFVKHKVIASVQPLHLAADIPIIRKYLDDRAQLTYSFKSLQESGAMLIFGSDTPIESFNPWHAIYTAMERKYLMDPSQPAFFPEQKLDLVTCLAAYTCNPARVVNMENKIGRIRTGMLADLFIPDRDIFSISSEELKDTKSLLTVVDGKIVHQTMD
jgi:predicted amidohydrolase YtcJ